MTYPPCPVMEIGVCNFVFPFILFKFKSLTALNELLLIIKCFHSMEIDPTFQEKKLKEVKWLLGSTKYLTSKYYFTVHQNLARKFLPRVSLQGFFQQFWEKAPGKNWEKMIN